MKCKSKQNYAVSKFHRLSVLKPQKLLEMHSSNIFLKNENSKENKFKYKKLTIPEASDTTEFGLSLG